MLVRLLPTERGAAASVQQPEVRRVEPAVSKPAEQRVLRRASVSRHSPSASPGAAGFHAADATAQDDARQASGLLFYAQHEVDRQALPASALELLDVMRLVGESTPMRLRLYIDRRGTVVLVELIEASAENRPAAARLALILRETGFVPAKRAGDDVATVQELEFLIDPPGESEPRFTMPSLGIKVPPVLPDT